jgi:hypothetical protein
MRHDSTLDEPSLPSVSCGPRCTHDLSALDRYTFHEHDANFMWVAAVVKWTAPLITLEKVLKVTEDSEVQAPELQEAEV